MLYNGGVSKYVSNRFMASIHKQGNKSDFWYCAYRLPDGRRVLRSTGETDKGKAETKCEAWDEAAKKARQGRLSTSIARKGFNDILETIGKAPMRDIKIGEYLSEWAEQQNPKSNPTGKQTTYLRYKTIVEGFIESLGDNATMPLETLEIEDVENFKKKMMKDGKSAGTVNTSIKILRIPLNQARRLGLLLTNPAEAVTTIKRPPNTRKVFTDKHIQDLLTTVEAKPEYAEWKGMILLSVYTGMRLKDAANLTWGNIDLENEVIRYTPTKTDNLKKEADPIPMHAELAEYFRSIPEGIPSSTPVFPKIHGKRVNSRNGLSRKFIEIMEAAKITDRKEQTNPKAVKGKGRHFFGLSFHSLRHTFISNLANQGVDKEMRKSIVGHSSDEHDKYTHIALEAKQKALAKLPRYKAS